MLGAQKGMVEGLDRSWWVDRGARGLKRVVVTRKEVSVGLNGVLRSKGGVNGSWWLE